MNIKPDKEIEKGDNIVFLFNTDFHTIKNQVFISGFMRLRWLINCINSDSYRFNGFLQLHKILYLMTLKIANKCC
jgi:hypothetical protein